MNKREETKLQRLIDATAETSNAFKKANDALMNFCIDTYGGEPGDFDVDDIIDAVLGGCGQAMGMKASEFDAQMRAAAGFED